VFKQILNNGQLIEALGIFRTVIWT